MIVDLRDYTLRQVGGALLLDLSRTLPRLLSRTGWVGVCNRRDCLERGPAGNDVRVVDDWSSPLYECRVFPPLGQWLMRRAFAQWPVNFAPSPMATENPELTFVLPFRGRERLPQLLATIASILGQEDVRVECLVVEQGNEPEVRGTLPSAVRYRHLPHPCGDTGWRKSWAFNVGALEARARVIVCHDADLVVPSGYGRAVAVLIEAGYESVHIQRFLFKLREEDTTRVVASRSLRGCRPQEVVQNWQGGTLAIRRDAFFAIGGFDERYVDWGGEDNEFFSRCMTLRAYRYGRVPFVHLWHPPQSTKFSPERDRTVAFLEESLRIPPDRRIDELRLRQPLLAIPPRAEGAT